ncbi:MAG TPA: hypothetical protein VMD97_01385 [Candidatus Aquilonibacter sp.]|nr:hypothetical protein [Candidatus Aquilonibacter sp.]
MNFLVAAAVFAAGAPLCLAQNIASTGPAEPSYTQTQPAPIERAYPNQNGPQNYGAYGQVIPGRGGPMPVSPVTIAPGGTVDAAGASLTANPIPGVILRVAPNSSVKEVVSDSSKLELRVERGLANVEVHDPQKNILILVDLPGGQTQMLKNGLYTFNATTNTARVLKGEALAFAASNPNAQPMKVKEYNKVEFGKDARPHEFVPQQAIADLIPSPRAPYGYGYGGGSSYGFAPGYGYGYAPYGDGPYGGYYPYHGYSPYWGFAEPYPWWGYPYGFYPWGGFGIGFGYYGGWGFHGGGFHGRR